MYTAIRNKWVLSKKRSILHWVLRKFLHIFYGNRFQEDMININIEFQKFDNK